MRKNILAFCLTLFFSGMYAQQAPATHLNIIPEPVSTIVKKGTFSPPKHITVSRPDGADNDLTVNFLTEKLRNFTDGKVTVKNSGKATIKLILNTTKDTSIGNEGYTLTVLPKNITIRANSAAGLFYGVQTLVQLFPPEIERPHTTACNDVKIPVLEITDYPRVGWRGLMLDVARHFFTVDEVKQYIDKMVRYK